MKARYYYASAGAAALCAAVAAIWTLSCHSPSRVPPSDPTRPGPEPEREEPAAPPGSASPEEEEGAEPADDRDPEAREVSEEGPTYVVAPGGDDGAAGDPDDPWRTLAHAAAQVEAGATVRVRPGRYDGFELKESGREGAPIRFLGGGDAIIDDPSRPDGINLEGASHVEIRGFRVRRAERAGIRAVECERVTIRANELYRNGKWGILTGFCDHVKIRENRAARAGEQHGIYVGNSSEGPRVEDNEIWGNPRAGVHMNGDASLGGTGVIEDARIRNNVIRENGASGAAAINLDGVRDSVIANNLIHDNESAGIALYRIDGGAPSTGNVVVHNTVVMAQEATRAALLLRDGAQGTTMYNNIFVAPNPRAGAVGATRDSLPSLASDANLYTDRFAVADAVIDFGDWRELTAGDGESAAAPGLAELFADPDGGDFRPASGSPARAAGKALGRSESVGAERARDLLGVARPERDRPDIGCCQAPAEEARTGTGPAHKPESEGE